MKAAIFALALVVISCDQAGYQNIFASLPSDASTSECARGVLPDPKCTPGAVMTVDMGTICHTTTDARRHVDRKLRMQVYQKYGVSYPQGPGMYEVDHLIPLELGGSNDLTNLWLEAAEPRPGFHEKDQVENYLHAQVCNGSMTLFEAQTQIRTNWLGVYERIK